jgi:3',5'-cyclic AMP phosphodiesterase CpdA
MMMSSRPADADAVIIHLSDLHFSGFLQNVDNAGEWSQVAKTHDFLVLQELESIVMRILKEHHERAIVVLTGDLTTAAEPPAYELLTTYLFGKVWISENKKVGLGMHDLFGMQDRILVIPGNHDAWLRLGGMFRRLTRWRNYFDRRQLFRQYFGLQPQVRPLVVGGVSFIFYLIDSNEVLASFFNPSNIRNALGRGRVGRQQISQILAQHNQLMNGNATLPAGFDLNGAIRIAALHHHPAVPDDLPIGLEQRLQRLQDDVDVTALFEEQLRTHLVVCGHQHFPYVYPDPAMTPGARPWLSCAGTATQHANAINSFKLYWIYGGDQRRLEIEEYRRERREGAVSKFQARPRIGVPLA